MSAWLQHLNNDSRQAERVLHALGRMVGAEPLETVAEPSESVTWYAEGRK